MVSANETDQPGSKFAAKFRWRKAENQGRGKKKTKYYFYDTFSRNSIIFLCLALFQAVVVITLMINIIVLGDYNDELVVDSNGTTYDQLSCSEKVDLRHDINNRNFSNVTEPEGFGEDKLIYVILFMCVVVYNFSLLLYALWFQSILEVTAFVVLNVLVTMYSCVQVYQFRGVDSGEFLTTVGYFALANTLFLATMTILFIILFHDTYFEFGWKMYKRIRRSEWRFYYRWYQTLMSLGKLTVLFTIVFELGQCILFLDHCDWEFYTSILIMIVAIAVLVASYFIVKNEHKLLTIGLGLSLILLAAYLIFKIVRFATRSCPLCQLRSNLPFSQREQTFGHLIMLASINLILDILTFLVLIVVYHNYSKGLREQFRQMSNTKATYNGKGATAKKAHEDIDHAPRPDSSQFKVLQPDHEMEESANNSLHRTAQRYFHRQTITSPPRDLDSVRESDVEAARGSQFEVVLQASNKPEGDTTMTTPPPAQRPPTLLPLKQNSIELHTQQ